jgi:hypothetical protein
MLLTAEITAFDVETNTYSVVIPRFNLPNSYNQATNNTIVAQISAPPGVYQGYNIGDRVWVGLDRNLPDKPVIIGHMSVPQQEAAANGGSIKGKILSISEKASLPKATTIAGAEADYSDLSKLIKKIKDLEERTYGSTSGDLPSTLEDIQNTLITLDNNSGTGNGSGGAGGGGVDDDALQAALFSTITAIQPEDSMETNFPVGKILFVRDNLGKKYSLWSEMDVFPVYSNSAASSKNVEFSNGQQNTKFQKLPGCWKIKAFLEGGFLVQRCQESTEVYSNSIVLVGNGSFAIACDLYNQDKEALSWYWVPTETGDGRELKSILSKDLVFFTTAFDNTTRVALRDSTKTQIFEICVPKEQPFADEDPYQVIQNYKGPANERVDSLAVLNLAYAGADQKLLNKDLKPCRFESNYTQNSVFNSGNAGFGPECIYLPDNYNNVYAAQGITAGETGAFTYTRLDNSLFMTAKNLVEIYIPENTGYVDSKVFAGTGERRRSTTSVRLLNMENTHIHFFGDHSLQNVRFENNSLKLPKKPLLDKITFDEAVFSYVNWPSNVPTLKTLYVYSALDFDHKLNGTAHKGAFYCANSYINRYVKELVYPITNVSLNQRTYVLNLLRESSLLSFLKADTTGNVTPEHVIELLDAFEEHCRTADPHPDVTLITGDGEAKLRFVDMRRIDTIYTLGSATIPTIIYNY